MTKLSANRCIANSDVTVEYHLNDSYGKLIFTSEVMFHSRLNLIVSFELVGGDGHLEINQIDFRVRILTCESRVRVRVKG